MKTINYSVHCVVFLMLLFVMSSCDDQKDGRDKERGFSLQDTEETTCVSCHTDKELLKEVADPEEVKEDSGEG